MSQSLMIHTEQLQFFFINQVNKLETLFQKWINTKNLNGNHNHSFQLEQQAIQSQTARQISHFQYFLNYLRSKKNDDHISILGQIFYSSQSTTNNTNQSQALLIKTNSQRSKLLKQQKGRQFSTNSNLIDHTNIFIPVSYKQINNLIS
ncbi:unnamed protein product [Paramecium sonneborni]|uniref:Uncharacterized protein n=1 Tax=Paramecium sonneborni TaxID=65129 RepID=A0A8S1KPJ2_9CILI|nr:unnamed protein product [Paramecium sonneborni]